MKTFLKILLFVVVFVLAAGAAVSYYFAANAKRLVPDLLERQLGFKPRIENIRVVFPSTVIVEGFSLEGGIRAQRISVTPSLAGLLSREVILNGLLIEQPRMVITRLPDDSFDFGLPPVPAKSAAPPSSRPSASPTETGGKEFRVYVEKFQIRDATVDFVDKGIVEEEEPFSFSLTDLDLDVSRISLLQPFKMRVEGKGRLVSEGKGSLGSIALSGWVDPLARDMDMKVALSDVLLAALKPYARKIFGRPLASGRMLFTADLKSEKNDLKGICHAEFDDVSFEKASASASAEGEPPDSQELTTMAVGVLLTPEGRAVFDFSFRTKMDRPRFEKVKIKGTFLQSKIKEIAAQPPQKTAEDFKEIGKQFEAVADEFKNIFRSL